MVDHMTLGAVLHQDFELLDFYGPLEMFGLVGKLEIVTVAEHAGEVASFQGPKGVADVGFTDCPPLDLILVPGGAGTFPQLENQAMVGFLASRSAEAQIVMSVCSGSALLAKAGVLDGHRATSNKQFFFLAERVSDQVEWITDARWVDDGHVVTSSGVSAGMDMALAVIERLWGPDEAVRIADLAEYTRQTDPTIDPFADQLNQGPALMNPSA